MRCRSSRWNGTVFRRSTDIIRPRLSTRSPSRAPTIFTAIYSCGRAVYGLKNNQDEDLYTARGDWQINSAQSFYARFTAAKLNNSSTYDGKNPLSLNQFGINDLDYGIALGHTWVMTPNLV